MNQSSVQIDEFQFDFSGFIQLMFWFSFLKDVQQLDAFFRRNEKIKILWEKIEFYLFSLKGNKGLTKEKNFINLPVFKFKTNLLNGSLILFYTTNEMY